MIYHFRDSVRSYLHDRMISAGVDLLAASSGKLAPDLRWGELPGYYDAWLAAQRVKADWAMTLLELWDATWLNNVPTGWIAADPDEQVMENSKASPHPHTIWDQSWFVRLFERNSERLYLCADLENFTFKVGLWLEDKRGKSLLTRNVPGMTYDRESEILWLSEPPQYADDGSLDLGKTIETCRAVKELVEER